MRRAGPTTNVVRESTFRETMIWMPPAIMNDAVKTMAAPTTGSGSIWNSAAYFGTNANKTRKPDAEKAINNARDVYTRRNEGVSIWAVEARHIAASSPSEKGPLYEPSQSKVYRHPTFFDIPEEAGHM